MEKILSNFYETLHKLSVQFSTLLKNTAETIAIIEKNIELRKSKFEEFINREENKSFLGKYITLRTLLRVSETGLNGTYFPLFANDLRVMYGGMTQEKRI